MILLFILVGSSCSVVNVYTFSAGIYRRSMMAAAAAARVRVRVRMRVVPLSIPNL